MMMPLPVKETQSSTEPILLDAMAAPPSASSTTGTAASTTAPIHVSNLVSTTLLCGNRTLGEPGLSRMIAGYYKDLLVDDVLERLGSLRRNVASAMTRSCVMSVVSELAEYLQYYSGHLRIAKQTMALFKTLLQQYDWLRPILATTSSVLERF